MSNVKITTELDDKASPGLKRLKDGLDGLKGNGITSSLKELSSQFQAMATNGSLAGGAINQVVQGGSTLVGRMATIGAVTASAALGIKSYADRVKQAAQTEEVFAAAIKRRNDANDASKAFTAAFGRVNTRSTDPAMQALVAQKGQLNAVAREANGLLKSLGIDKTMASAELATANFVRTAVLGFGSVAAIAATVYAGIEAIAVSSRAAADNQAELADKMGLTVGQLEAMQIVAAENGTSVESLQKVFDKLSKSMNKADEDNAKATYAFESLGISVEELAGKTEKEVAGIIIRNFELLGRNTKATAAVMQLLGPAFREQIPAIKEMATGVRDADERVRKFGAEATPQLIGAGKKQETAFIDLKLAWKGFANEVATSAGSAVQSAAEMISDILNWVRIGLKGVNEYKAKSAEIKSTIAPERRQEITKQVRDEQARGFVPRTQEAFIARRLELYDEEMKKINAVKVAEEARAKAETDAEVKRLKAKSEAAKPKPTKEVKELKSELEAMVVALNQANQGFLLDDAGKQALEARKKYVRDIAEGMNPKAAQALLNQALAAIQVGDALKKAAEEQKAFKDASKTIADYEAETALMAYEATLIGKTAAERAKLIEKFREEAQLRLIIKGLSADDAKTIVAQTQTALAARDSAKAALEQTRLTNEILGQSNDAVQAELQRRISAAQELLAAGKIGVDDYTRYVKSSMDSLIKDTETKLTETQELWKTAAQGIQQDFQSFFFDAMQGETESLSKRFKKTIDSIIAQILAAKVATALFGTNIEKGQMGGYAGAAATFLGGLFGGGRATGGSVQAGRMYMVGERGPEPFIPTTSGTILPSGSLNNSGPSVTVNLTAIDTKDFMGKMSEVKRELAGLVNNTNRTYGLRGAY